MTADQILSLLMKLNDTIDAQAATIEQLQKQLADTQEKPWPTPTDT